MKIVISQNSPLDEARRLLTKHPKATILAHEAYEEIGRSRDGRLGGFTQRDGMRGTEPNIIVLDFWSLTHELIVTASCQLGRKPGVCRLVLCVKPWPRNAVARCANIR